MTTSTRNQDIVLRFIGQFAEGWPADYDIALAPLAENATYQIIVPSTPPIQGRAAIKSELLRMQQKVHDNRSEIKAVAANGRVVFTERVDYSKRGEGSEWRAIPLAAVFELDDEGRITAWREYLDSAAIAAQHGMTTEQLLQSLTAA